jgi:hypothetical protein
MVDVTLGLQNDIIKEGNNELAMFIDSLNNYNGGKLNNPSLVVDLNGRTVLLLA